MSMDIAEILASADRKKDATRSFALSSRTIQCVLAPPKVNTWEWVCENVHNHKGAPFNPIDFPWVEGICEAWDDPAVRTLTYQAGSRLGKTETFLDLLICSQFHDPDVGMITGPTQRIVEKTIGDRFYHMLEKSHATRWLCPPEHRRNRRVCRTKTFTIYGAWSGSPTTLSDLDPRYVLLFEFDKYTKNSSEEADPGKLALERGAEIPDRKAAIESTPTIEGRSRINKRLVLGTNKRYRIPCPKCGMYHQLLRNETNDPKNGGLWWDRDDEGVATASQAADTARYVCPSCKKEWSDDYRLEMVRRGKWVAAGQTIDKKGVVKGKPTNHGPDESFQLSRLYGATFPFGAYAREFVQSIGDPESMRSFANNWDGETWVPIQIRMKWDELAKKVCVGEWEIGVVPHGCTFVTSASDVQKDHFVCVAYAWDNKQRAHLIAYDTVSQWSDVKQWCRRSYPHQDGGDRVPSFVNLIDAKDGNRTAEVIEFCMSSNSSMGPFIYPSMGARPGSLAGKKYRRSRVDDEGKTGEKAKGNVIEGLYLITVNTDFSQQWLDHAMDQREPGDPMSIIMPTTIADDEDFFEQMVNESFNPDVGLWEPVHDDKPWDFRDATRYARIAADLYCRGNWSRISANRPVIVQTKAEREQQKREARKKPAKSRKPSQKETWISKPKKKNAFLKNR